jgi:hypothetical protein
VLPVVLALLAAYAVVVTFQMRRAVRASEPTVRQREAIRLLLLVSAGVPLSAVLILVAV